MRIDRCLTIEDQALRENIWEFYNSVFAPLNAQTPISQSWPKADIMAWLSNEEVVKFLLWNEDEELIGFGAVTTKLELDIMISQPYFDRYYPGVDIYDFPVIAVKDGCHKLGFTLVYNMIMEVPKNGIGLFFSSNQHNPNIARFASIAMKGKIEIDQADSEVCHFCRWKD